MQKDMCVRFLTVHPGFHGPNVIHVDCEGCRFTIQYTYVGQSIVLVIYTAIKVCIYIDHHSLGAGGEWVTAYQAQQRSRLRTVFLSQEPRLTGHTHLTPPTNTREASGVGRRRLDRGFLTRHCFVEQPTDLSEADISGVQQNSVRITDTVVSGPRDFSQLKI